MLMNILRFVDRDMLIRYHWGLGIGHKYSWEGTQADTYCGPLSNYLSATPSGPRSSGNSVTECQALIQLPTSEQLDVHDNITDDMIVEEEDQIEPEPVEDLQHDGMEDRENEDLGDDWYDDDDDPLWDPKVDD